MMKKGEKEPFKEVNKKIKERKPFFSVLRIPMTHIYCS